MRCRVPAAHRVAVRLQLLLNPHAHQSLDLCATGDLLFALTSAVDGVLGEMSADASFDSLESACAPVSAGVDESSVVFF